VAISRTSLKVISLYTGVGGLDFGFEAVGFKTAVAVEMDPAACRTIRLNRNWPMIEGDISAISTREILQAGRLKVGEAAVLIAGPPCQPFSKSGYWVNGDTRRLDDPRSKTLDAFLRVLRGARPKSFLLENVYGLAYEGKDEGLKLLIDGIRRVNRATGDNYSVAWQMLNAADYGVPQTRERIFIVGSRDGREFDFPPPSHTDHIAPADLFLRTLAPHVPAWDAIGDLPRPRDEQTLTVRGKWGALLPTIPEGQNYLWHTNRRGGMPLFGWRTRYWSFLLKLSKRRPSWTIQAQPGAAIGPFHWENRRLTSKEMCRLQTFPEDIRFDCGRTEVQRMLGNAVPALLAEVIAGKMAEQFFGRKPIKRPTLLPTPKRPIPPEEEPGTVPKQYLKYVGNHADHPGERRKP